MSKPEQKGPRKLFCSLTREDTKMRLLLRGVRKKDQDAVQRSLENAFAETPQIAFEEESEAGGSVQVTAFYPPDDERDRETVRSIVDGVLMRNNYVFCNVQHRDEPTGVGSGTPQQAPGWPSL